VGDEEMVSTQNLLQKIRLTKEQREEGYWVERSGDLVTVWHNRNQIALLLSSPSINEKVQEVVERKRKEHKEVEAKAGWKLEK
jgi:hypothetical protein